MKWIVMNGLGGAVWLAGLCLAKGGTLPESVVSAVGDNHVTVGMTVGIAGLALLLWTNLRNMA